MNAYEKWTDEELRKAQRQNWIKLVKNEFYIVAFFGLALLLYLAAKNELWWLICGGAGFLAVCVFVYSLCFVAGRADELAGLQEWQQGEAKDEA